MPVSLSSSVRRATCHRRHGIPSVTPCAMRSCVPPAGEAHAVSRRGSDRGLVAAPDSTLPTMDAKVVLGNLDGLALFE